MTDNIRVNGYDTTTAPDSGCTQRSTYWACNAALCPKRFFFDKSPVKSMGETWKVFSDNGRVRVNFPAQGAHTA